MEPETRATLLVAAGGDLNRLIESALGAGVPTEVSESTLIAFADSAISTSPFGKGLIDACKRKGNSVRTIVPPRTLAGSWTAARKVEWLAVELPPRTERVQRVWLPGSIVNVATMVAVNRLPVEAARTDSIALGIWARFAHPRQRTGARLSDDRTGLTAEIAMAVKPKCILLFEEWRGFPFLIASDDQIASELAGISYSQTVSKTPPESGGPWEHPLVQRATELGIGVNRPGLIDATISWHGFADASVRQPFEEFASDLLARMGVTAQS